MPDARPAPDPANKAVGQKSGVGQTHKRIQLTVLDLEFSVYIVRCSDNTYYTGIAADVARRLKEHASSPRGAKYLKGRGPLQLVFQAAVGDRSVASQLEYRIKKLDRAAKQALIDGALSLADLTKPQASGAG